MPICPKCGNQIQELTAYTVEYNTYAFFINGDWGADYEQTDSFWDEVKFCCPICGATLFLSIEEAEKFLRGKEVAC